MADERYIEAVGRRKTATARTRITPSKTQQQITINGKPVDTYFPTATMRNKVLAPLALDTLEQKFSISVKVTGGGIAAQSEAVRHGIARALTKYDAALRAPLKQEGYLTRDPRMKERRKFGLRKARRAPQWSKR